MSNLVGLHDKEGIAIAASDTWLLDTIALSENPQPAGYLSNFNWIVRLNWGYGSTGTLPRSDLYGEYVSRVANYVKNSEHCHRWIVGNEPNLSREWPDGEPIFPWQYAQCYRMTRRAIRAIPGHEHDEVLIAASGPWNNEMKYEGNPNGDWIQNFADVIERCGDVTDGFALHSYTHSYNVALVTSSARMQAPFQNRHYEFRAYRDYMEAIPDSLGHLPVYITEANGNGPWQAVGLMPAMLGEINAWNQASKQKIHAVIFYRYPRYDDFFIEGKADVINEYHAAVARGYTSPVKEKEQMDSHLPVVTSGTPITEPSLPPQRQIDPRATARGVTIEMPQVAPGQAYWRVKQVRWYNEQEADGLGPDHHIMADALDEQGKRVVGVVLTVSWPTDNHNIATEAKAGELYSANYPMSPSRNEFSVRISGAMPSENVKGIGMGMDTPSGFNPGAHTTTGVVFQRATMPATTQPPPIKPPPASVPTLTHPIQDSAKRVISQRFGENPQDYVKFGLAGHPGLDFAVPQGTPIVAADDGEVIESLVNADGYGEYVKLKHAWGESLYAHLSKRNLLAGRIGKGGLIGLSGNTGNSTGPHLHFGVRVNPYTRGVPYDGYSDPESYLKTTQPGVPTTELLQLIKLAATEFGVEWQLLASQAWAESSFNPKAQSAAGAKGLMQIMDATWAEWSPKVLGGNDPFNPKQNLRVGAAYLKWLIGTVGNKTFDALVAYGWGIGNVLGDTPFPDIWTEYANKIIHGRNLLKAIGA